MKKVIFASLLCIFSSSTIANEQSLTTECSTCFSYEQFKNSAKSNAQLDKTRDVYVMNLEALTIKKFEVSKRFSGYKTLTGTGGESDWRGGKMKGIKVPTYSVTVKDHNVEQSVLNNFYNLSDAKKQVMMSVQSLKADEVPSEIAGSVWDLVGSSSIQNKVARHYNGNTNLRNDLTNFANATDKVSGLLNVDKIMMQVSFSDGSTAIFSLYAVINGDLIWDFERGTDVDLNKVKPNFDTKNAESYDFDKGGADVFVDFYNAAKRAGVSFTSTSSEGAQTGGRVTCVTKNLGKYICTYTR